MRLVFCAIFLLLTGCRRFDLLNATVPGGNYTRTADLAFGHETRQKLDVYLPREMKADAPVVVFFYGGSWTSGRKEDYRFVAEALTSRGWLAVLPDYRLLPGVQFPVFMEDAASAVRWAKHHLTTVDGRPRQIFLMGHSAGAYIAARLVLDPQYFHAEGLDRADITAVAGLSGPYAYIPPPKDRVASRPFPATSDSEFDLLSYAPSDGPPLLLIHGLADDFVSPLDTSKLERRLREKGYPVEARYYAGKDHVSTALSLARPFKWVAPTLDDVTAFFRRYEVH